MNVLIGICSKYPNPFLFDCIKALKEVQINSEQEYKYKIEVVDSDSTDNCYYELVSQNFPDVEISMIKNKNFEYGAYKYLLNKYPDFDIYYLIQDSITIFRHIDLKLITDETAYAFHDNSGYHADPVVKKAGIENLIDSGLNYENIIDGAFLLAQHNSFIVNRKTLIDLFKHLKNPPVDKEGGRFYERNFGIYFIDKNIRTINLHDYMHKTHGNRNF